MTIINTQRRLYTLLACLLCGMLYHVPALRAEESNVIITHPTISGESLSRNALRGIFGMRLQAWPNNTPIRVFVLPDDAPLHNAFCKEMLNVFPYQLRAAWDRLVFSGTGQAPIEVASEDEMLAKIASTPGAIGYLPRSKINDSVHVLQID